MFQELLCLTLRIKHNYKDALNNQQKGILHN